MTWEIFIGITVVISFIISVVTPLIKLTKTMTELNANMRNLSSTITELTIRNTESHRRLWEHNEDQDAVINNHEQRITKIETKMEIMHPESK